MNGIENIMRRGKKRHLAIRIFARFPDENIHTFKPDVIWHPQTVITMSKSKILFCNKELRRLTCTDESLTLRLPDHCNI